MNESHSWKRLKICLNPKEYCVEYVVFLKRSRPKHRSSELSPEVALHPTSRFSKGSHKFFNCVLEQIVQKKFKLSSGTFLTTTKIKIALDPFDHHKIMTALVILLLCGSENSRAGINVLISDGFNVNFKLNSSQLRLVEGSKAFLPSYSPVTPHNPRPAVSAKATSSVGPRMRLFLKSYSVNRSITQRSLKHNEKIP